MKTSNIVLSIGFIFMVVLSSFCLPQTKEAVDPRKLIDSYITAFNNGEEKMRNFIIENFSENALAQRSINERIITYNQMRNDIVELKLQKIDEITPSSISAYLRAKNGDWLLYTFTLDSQPPHKISRIRVEQTDEPETISSSTISEKDAIKTIEQFLNEQSVKDLFSGTVLIAKNEKSIFKNAYGLANKEHGVKNKVDTKFNLGSINKIFTKIAIGQLYENGKLALSDNIIKYIPDYPNKIAAEKVTIQHLLDMTSGIGDFFNEKFEATPKDKFRNNSDYLEMFASDPLLFEPGTQRNYSNGSYALLGVIIEKVSGQSYYEYVREKIFKPCGMLNTDSYEADVPVPNLAEGYTRDSVNQPWRKNIYTRPARGSSAGGGYSTAEDLLKFTIDFANGKYFKQPDTWAKLEGEKQSPSTQKHGILGIYGGAPGINAGIETFVGTGYTIIVLANYDPPAVMEVMKKVKSFLKEVK